MKKKKGRSEDDYFEYKEEGEIKILKLQCDNCRYQLKELYVCDKFLDRKPLEVLRCEEECPKFEAKQ